MRKPTPLATVSLLAESRDLPARDIPRLRGLRRYIDEAFAELERSMVTGNKH
jgi:hypothetical protein